MQRTRPSGHMADPEYVCLLTLKALAPVTFFVALILLQDKGCVGRSVLAWFLPQSFMIRGVLSPGPAWRQLMLIEARRRVLRNVDADICRH
jgi:hypothetical protein